MIKLKCMKPYVLITILLSSCPVLHRERDSLFIGLNRTIMAKPLEVPDHQALEEGKDLSYELSFVELTS